MIIVLTKTLEDGPQIVCAMICTIIIPQDLLLARCKMEFYASIKKLCREGSICGSGQVRRPVCRGQGTLRAFKEIK